MNDRADNPARALSLSDRLALRPREAAAALGVSERSFRQLLSQIPHVREGGMVLVPVEALREWLRHEAKAQHQRANAEADAILRALGGAKARGTKP
ncbi:MAG TPA: helix-turn-helix domain-containing protein [Myxococcota bacterium]|nr:helix-turn-helix domain-containing protein [Myxococcota bacterium]